MHFYYWVNPLISYSFPTMVMARFDIPDIRHINCLAAIMHAGSDRSIACRVAVKYLALYFCLNHCIYTSLGYSILHCNHPNHITYELKPLKPPVSVLFVQQLSDWQQSTPWQTRRFDQYPSVLLHQHVSNHMVTSVTVMQTWRMWLNEQHESTKNLYSNHSETESKKLFCGIYCIDTNISDCEYWLRTNNYHHGVGNFFATPFYSWNKFNNITHYRIMFRYSIL